MKATKLRLLGILSLFLVFTACQDDFTEKDLLELQAELAETAAANDHARQLALIAAEHQNLLDAIAAEGANSMAVADHNDALNRAYQEFLNQIQSDEYEANYQRALDLLRSTGLIADYTVRVQDNGTPISGATVVMSAGSVQDTLTTPANGEVTFTDVPASILTVDLMATNYISMRYTSNLATGNLGDNGGDIVRLYVNGQSVDVADPRHELITAQMLSSVSTAGTAVIKGNVSGNVDLTTEDTEALSGLVVEAQIKSSLDDFLLIADADGDPVDNIRFGVAESFGRDTTDANGDYSMVVPAYTDLDGDKIMYSLTFPAEVTADQTVAHVDSDDSVRIITTPATWGPYVMDEDDFPFVYGYQSDYASPSNAGSGFAISTPTKYGRTMNDADHDWGDILTATAGQRTQISDETDNTDFSTLATLTQAGSGYTLTPTFTVSDGGSGTDARGVIEMDWDFDEIGWSTIDTASDGSSIFNANEGISIYLGLIGTDRSDGTTVDTTYVDTNVNANNSDADARIDSDTVDISSYVDQTFEDTHNRAISGILLQLRGDGSGADSVVSSFYIDYSASADATNSNSSNGLEFDDNGSLYSDPTFTFAGGGSGATLPTLTVDVFATIWAFNMDNSNSSGYVTVPETMEFTGEEYTNLWNKEDLDNNASVSSYTSSGGFVQTADFNDQLTVSGDTLAPLNEFVTSFRTSDRSVSAPTLEVTDSDSEAANIFVTFDAAGGEDLDDGEIVSLNGGTDDSGQIAAGDRGAGYTSTFTLSINARTVASTPSGYTLAIAPSTAADITLEGFTTDNQSKIVTWDGNFTINDGGEGYVGNINQAETANTSFTFTEQPGGTAGDEENESNIFDVETGGTYTIDVDYGTGERSAELEGDDEDTGN